MTEHLMERTDFGQQRRMGKLSQGSAILMVN